jgi:uncharacterized RDD family membrane protein YckC
MARAGFFARFIGFLIDNLALSVIAWLLSIVIGPLLGATATAGFPILSIIAGGLGMILALILVFLQFFYFGWMWSRNGQSFGMRIMNIKVTRRDGSLLSFWRSGFRGTVGYWISGLVFGLGFLWAAFDGKKEAWHDKLFDTGVFQA